MPAANIHVGVDGWDYDPWRGTFYPAGLPKSKQLEFAALASAVAPGCCVDKSAGASFCVPICVPISR